MGATNTTANYNLSQFIGTDKPAWLQDYNGDMLKIDTGINAAKVAADGAQNSADAAQNDATTANNAITNTINPAISTLNSTVGSLSGAVNTINSLIGNGTPTTTDQTIIGAINEINAKVDGNVIVSVNSNGVKTKKELLNDLFSSYSLVAGDLSEAAKLNLCFAIITATDMSMYKAVLVDSSELQFQGWNPNSLFIYAAKAVDSLALRKFFDGTTTYHSDDVVAVGERYVIYI